MSARRGLKGNPFVIGECVFVWELDVIAKVEEIVYPKKSRGQLKYQLSMMCEFDWEVDIGEFLSSDLVALSDLKGHEDE